MLTYTRIIRLITFSLLLFINVFVLVAQTTPRKLEVWRGSTPTIDGIIDVDEYSDATSFQFDKQWYEEYGTVTDPLEYSLKGWVKHDGTNLFFAFDVTDSVVYGVDIPRWTPNGSPKANSLTQAEDWPFWGDAIEIFLHTSNKFSPTQAVAGNGYSWNAVCNAQKSRLGQLQYGGLVEGYPRDNNSFNTYKNWILNGDLEAKVRIKTPPELNGYVIEWKIKSNPCMQMGPGNFWRPSYRPDTMRINFEPEDVDRKIEGNGFANMHHIIQYSGEKNKNKGYIANWAMLIIHPELPTTISTKIQSKISIYPNPLSDILTVSAESNARIQVMDITGKVLINLTSEKLITKVDMTSLVKGIYLIKVNAAKEEVIKKVVRK